MHFWGHHAYEKCTENIYLYFCQDNFTLPKTSLKDEASSNFFFPFTKFSKIKIHIPGTSLGTSFPGPKGIQKLQQGFFFFFMVPWLELGSSLSC